MPFSIYEVAIRETFLDDDGYPSSTTRQSEELHDAIAKCLVSHHAAKGDRRWPAIEALQAAEAMLQDDPEKYPDASELLATLAAFVDKAIAVKSP